MTYVDTLVGLQWGSEGKGKIAKYLSKEYKAMIRSGGPQASHTFYHKQVKYINRQVPCGVFDNCSLYIAPAGLINPKILMEEIKRFNLDSNKLMIDKKSIVITESHISKEINSSLKKRLASTCQGVGAAQSEKIWRKQILFENLIKNNYLKQFSGDVVKAIHTHINNKEHILIEGTLGFGLCLNHGNYPFVTSRDVTCSALLNDIGVSPKDHRKTIGVLRTYPIRVGGNSGFTHSFELTWKEIEKRSRSTEQIKEFTTVTKRVLRVFEQDFETLKKAIIINKPDILALKFTDYINFEDYGKQCFDDLSDKSKKYIFNLEQRLKMKILLIGTGPRENHIIDRRNN